MVKWLITVAVLAHTLYAEATVYTQNCLPCHKDMAVKIDKFFYRYLLKYSSEAEVKRAMIHYLQHPKAETSILTDGLINRFGVKKKTSLNEEELKEAIDTYWETYKVFDKLK